MLTSLFKRYERFLGRGSASVTIPPMDGALKPNSLLDGARSVAATSVPDNLVVVGVDAFFTTDNKLIRISSGQWDSPTVMAEFYRPILAAAVSPDGAVAVALDGAGVRLVGGSRDGMVVASAANQALDCVVALTFSGNDALIACNGSSRNRAADWRRDLLDSERSGSVWMLDLTNGASTLVADRLGFPYGVMALEGGADVLISESWKCRVTSLNLCGKGAPKVVLDGLPGYPSRLSPRVGGGAWLAMFAPRNQLIEFVIREKAYRRAMMAEVDPEFWIAPALSSGKSFSEPMQGGALKQMGILKPWAPTRSYGLVIELGPDLEPIASLHSRAGGSRHGITSCQQSGDELLMTSRGGNEIIAIRIDAGGERHGAGA